MPQVPFETQKNNRAKTRRGRKKSSIYFLYAYSPLKQASTYCDNNWGYGLIGSKGELIKLFSTDDFKERCARLGIVEGIGFLAPEWEGTAISKGFLGDVHCESVREENAPDSMSNLAIAFSPITMNVSRIRHAPDFLRPYSLCPDGSRGKYGGVVVLAFPECGMKPLLPLSDALASQVFIQLHWLNMKYSDYASDTCFLSIFQPTGRQQIVLASSNTWRIFEVPEKRVLFRERLDALFDELPANKELWAIVNSRKAVKDVVMSLEKDGKLFDVAVTTRFNEESRFFTEEFVIIIQSLLKFNKLRDQYVGSTAHYTFENIVHGNSKSFNNVLDAAETASRTPSNILLMGESGTGKDVLAQAIHNASLRNDQPFVAINCASFSRELIASELFGYEPGAFTGAKKNGSIGKFEAAKQGTLFLDEIGDMPLDLQVMLLRVLEERRFMKVGGTTEIEVDTRIIAATNKDLKKLIEQKMFREDLYYRLGVVKIKVPPLRDRLDDILPLANYYLNTICTRQGKPIVFLSEAAKSLLLSHQWPGNIRELRNLIEGIISTQNCSEIDTEHLLRYMDFSELKPVNSKKISPVGANDNQNPPPADNGKKLVIRKTSSISKQSILDTLVSEGNNINKVAAKLGISRRTLYRRLHEYDLMG